jgi:HEAT repeat protein
VWPDVAERIETALASSDPVRRRAGAAQLGTLAIPRAAPLVLRALADDDDDVKLAAADAALRLRLTAATELVIPWMTSPKAPLRRKACEVARAAPSPLSLAPLARALSDSDPEVRLAAAEALGFHDASGAVPPLLGRLDDPHPAVRVQIVGALARLGDSRAIVPLVGKVQDSASEVRLAVVRALGLLGDRRASQALVLALREVQPDIRREALMGLGKLRAADAVDAIAAFSQDRQPLVRAAALGALGKIASPEALGALVALLGTGDDTGLELTPLREALVSAGLAAIPLLGPVLEGSATSAAATSAACIVGELGAGSQARTVLLSMRRGVLAVPAALRALGGMAGTDMVAVVLEFVGDSNSLVRDEARRAAGRLLDPGHPDGRAVEPLVAALRKPFATPSERAELAMLLGRTGAPRAGPALVELAQSEDASLRLAALQAFSVLGPAGADAVLLDLMKHREPETRLRAAVALSITGTAASRDALLERLEASGEMDRTLVITALGGILSRAPSDGAIEALHRRLALSSGADRDGILVALGRAARPLALLRLTEFVSGADVDDRRTVAGVLAARSDGEGLALKLLADPDPSVRAQAAWSLGALGGVGSVRPLDQAAGQAAGDLDTAVNAAASLGRVGARTKSAVAELLCARLSDARPYVRANALVSLVAVGGRCGDGTVERRLLSDPVDAVRGAAARLVGAVRRGEADTAALTRCADDRVVAVARLCGGRAEAAARSYAVEVVVVPEGEAGPLPRAGYALQLSDGRVRVGLTDRRGAVFEAAAPDGPLVLRALAAQ